MTRPTEGSRKRTKEQFARRWLLSEEEIRKLDQLKNLERQARKDQATIVVEAFIRGQNRPSN